MARNVRLAGIAVLLAAFGTAAGNAPAGTHEKAVEPRAVDRVATKVTFRDRCTFAPRGIACRPVTRRNYLAIFSGRLKSDVARCERGRTVKVFKTSSSDPGRGTKVVGTTKSNARGRWRLEVDKPNSGRFVAKATGDRKGQTFCRPGRKALTHDPVF